MNKLFAAHTSIEDSSEVLVAVGLAILMLMGIVVFLARRKKNKNR